MRNKKHENRLIVLIRKLKSGRPPRLFCFRVYEKNHRQNSLFSVSNYSQYFFFTCFLLISQFLLSCVFFFWNIIFFSNTQIKFLLKNGREKHNTHTHIFAKCENKSVEKKSLFLFALSTLFKSRFCTHANLVSLFSCASLTSAYIYGQWIQCVAFDFQNQAIERDKRDRGKRKERILR